MLRALLQAMRPHQWVKNLLVFAAPGAAGVLDERTAMAQALGAFGCFCLAASGTYLLNDAADESRQAGFKRLAVIASIGTREYYRQHGFETGEFYMARDL